MSRRRAITVCALGALACAVALVALTGCAAQPFTLGEQVAPPPGCIEYRKRGGQC